MIGSKPNSPPALQSAPLLRGPILGRQSRQRPLQLPVPLLLRLPKIGAGGLLCLLFVVSAPAQTPTAPSPPSIDLRYQALSGPLNKPHVEGVRVLYGGELSLRADAADADLLRGRYILSGNAAAHEADTTIKADKIILEGHSKHASAENALLTQKVFTLHVRQLDGTAQLLTATDGDLTTVPPGQTADARIHAQSILLDSVHHRGTLRNATLYLFRTRLLTVPRLSFHLGRGGNSPSHQAAIPVFGVSSRYGTYVSFGSSFGPASSPVGYRLLLPTRQAVEGILSSGQTLYTPRAHPVPTLSALPSDRASMLDQLRNFATAPRGLLPEGDPLLFHDFLPAPNPVRLFDEPSRGGVTLAEAVSVHQSASGRKRDDLYVTRLPEVTLSGQIPLTPIPSPPAYGDPIAFRNTLRHLVLYADAQQTYGRYREQLSTAPYVIRERRTRTQVGLSARPLLIGQNTVLLPRVSISSSSYSGSKTAYRYDQVSVAVNHYFSDLSVVSIQYLASKTSGDSPFDFDVLDTSRELDIRCQLGYSRLVAATRVRYDLSRRGVIDYQIAVSPALHGFSPVFSYNFRTRSLGLGIEVKGVTF